MVEIDARKGLKKILLLARDRQELVELPERMAHLNPRVHVHATRRMGEAVALLTRQPFDAAVCTVEIPRDVATVIRFKKTAPRTPVIALAEQEDPDTLALSLQMGAAAVIRRAADFASVARSLQAAIETRDLARHVRGSIASSWMVSKQIARLSARAKTLTAEAMSRFTANPAEGFEPLLVENDPDEAFFFVRALRKIGLHRRLPVVRTAEQAISYLAGRGEYADRVLYPVPSIVILDLHLGRENGEKVLRYIRSHPSLEHLPVILLSSSQNPVEVGRMVELGMSAHIVKPPTLGELYEVVRLILDYWHVWRTQSADVTRPLPLEVPVPE